MRYTSPLFSDARNKLGGTVFARNPYSLYTRPLVNPTQPRTAPQVANRQSFATLTKLWSTLTQTQRNSWNTQADDIVWTDTLGHQYPPSGQQLFMANNRNLSLIGLAPILTLPPNKGPIPYYQITTMNWQIIGGVNHLIAWYAATLTIAQISNCIVQMTPPTQPSINFVARASFRNISPFTAGPGDQVNVTTTAGALFGVATVGQKWFVRQRYIDPSTGYSGPTVENNALVIA